MADSLNKQLAIDALPPSLRTKAVDMLLAGRATRHVSAFLAQHGHKVSFSAVARYKRLSLRPALETATKLQQLQAIADSATNYATSTASLTKSALMADPILSRLADKYSRYDRNIAEAEQSKDFSSVASLDKAETSAMRLHAELTGRLQQNAQIAVQVVIGSGNATPASTMPSNEPSDEVIEMGNRAGKFR